MSDLKKVNSTLEATTNHSWRHVSQKSKGISHRFQSLLDRYRGACMVGMLTLFVLVAYANSLTNGFVFDDVFIIEKNPLVKGLEHIPDLLLTEYWQGHRKDRTNVTDTALYRPLPLITYNLNYAIGGLDPVGYHAVNVVLHLLVTWLVFRVALLIGLTQTGALVGAILFAVHPLHTEAVTGIVGRAELMMAAGVLGALVLFGRGRTLLAMIVYAAGLLSKEQAVMLPALVGLYLFCFPQPLDSKDPGDLHPARSGEMPPVFSQLASIIWYVAPFVLLLGVYLVLRLEAVGRITSPPVPFIDNPIAEAEWPQRLLTAVKVAGLYLWLCVWPETLSPDYSYQAIPIATSLVESGVLIALVAWGSLLGMAVWCFVRGDRRITFCVGLTAILFFPASNVLIPIGTIMGERLFYLPSAGLCLLVGLGWERLWAAIPSGNLLRFATVCVAGLVCIALTIRTIDRNRDWVNSLTLFQLAAETVPNSAKAHYFLSKVEIAKGNYERADAEYNRAMELYPGYTLTNSKFNTNLGALRIHQERLEEAVEILERAVSLDPQSIDAQFNLGLAYAKQGRYEEAEMCYRRALALDTEAAEPYNSLSYVLRKQEKYREALEAADKALAIKAQFKEAHYNRGRALEALGHIGQALEAYRQVIDLDPSNTGVQKRINALKAGMPEQG